ncbi:phage integrase SAM-like domain-containing protein [Hymenobacter sp. HD11105]
MNLSFRQRLDRPDREGRAVLFLDVTWDGQRLKLPTGVKCKPAHFQEDKRVKIATREPDSTRLNNKLSSVEKVVTNLFTKAEADGFPVTPELLMQTVASLEVGRQKKTKAKPAATPSFAQLYALWKAEHPGQGTDAARRYQQVLGRLEAFNPGLTLDLLTKATFFEYLGYLQEEGLSDGTISGHVKFLRVCFLLSERPTPSWLKFTARYGRAASLGRDEFAQILQLTDLPAYLQREKERTVFQTLLLLRDSDLRKLKAHHVSLEDIAGVGRVHVLRLYQTKTNEYLTLPLSPEAARIWEAWQGKVPVVVQQKRNLFIKELAQAAGLTRGHVRVRFKMGKPEEEVLPIWQAITTHTPRHTGADLVLWGSDGDQNLKELALGHTVGMSAYGYDSLERYAPLLLRAWQRVGAAMVFAPNPADSLRTNTDVCAPPAVGINLSPVRLLRVSVRTQSE